MARLAIRATGDRGRENMTTSNKGAKIDITVGNICLLSLVVQHEKSIVEPMNYHQSTDGYTVRSEEGKLLAFQLDKK